MPCDALWVPGRKEGEKGGQVEIKNIFEKKWENHVNTSFTSS
jgi:hypothetical protein